MYRRSEENFEEYDNAEDMYLIENIIYWIWKMNLLIANLEAIKDLDR